MWEDLVINLVLGIVTHLIKNPGKASSLRTQLLHVRDAINAIYPGA